MTLKQAEKQASARLTIYQTELDELYRRRANLNNALEDLQKLYWKELHWNEDLQELEEEQIIQDVNDMVVLDKTLSCPFALKQVILRKIDELAPEIERLEKILNGMQRQYSYLPYCYA